MDFLKKNHWLLIASIISIILVTYLYGCQSTTESIIDENKQISKQELIAEIEYLTDIAEAKLSEIQQQNEVKKKLVNTLALISESGDINPLGAINILAGIAGLSFGLDRNSKLKDVKNKIRQTDQSENSKNST